MILNETRISQRAGQLVKMLIRLRRFDNRPRQRHIGYASGQAVNYVLLRSTVVTAPLSSWTPIATNSGSLSVSNFVVSPSGSVNYYRVTSRNY